jgi:ketosteroid isomerase-like protein
MVSEKQAREILRRWVEEITIRRNAENLNEILTDDWVGHHPGRNLRIGDAKDMLRKRFAEVRMDDVIEDLIVSGDKVVVRWTERSISHSTGEEVCNAAVTIDRVRDGKFAETWYIWSDKPWLK